MLSFLCIKNKYLLIYWFYVCYYIIMIFDSFYLKENNVCYKLLEVKKKEKVNILLYLVLKKVYIYIYYYKLRLLFICFVYWNNSILGI